MIHLALLHFGILIVTFLKNMLRSFSEVDLINSESRVIMMRSPSLKLVSIIDSLILPIQLEMRFYTHKTRRLVNLGNMIGSRDFEK